MHSAELLGSTPWAHTSHVHVLTCLLYYSAPKQHCACNCGAALGAACTISGPGQIAITSHLEESASLRKLLSFFLALAVYPRVHMPGLRFKGRNEQDRAAPAKCSFWQRMDGLLGNLSGPVHFISLQLVPLCQLSEQGQGTPVSHVCFGFQLRLAPLPGSNGFQVSCELVPSTSTDNSPTEPRPPQPSAPDKCLFP